MCKYSLKVKKMALGVPKQDLGAQLQSATPSYKDALFIGDSKQSKQYYKQIKRLNKCFEYQNTNSYYRKLNKICKK